MGNISHILEKLAQADRKDRGNFRGNEIEVVKRDKRRRAAVARVLRSRRVLSGTDLYNAALIYHHGVTSTDYRRACELAERAVALGMKEATPLLALATDRLLVSYGKKQKYGTQFHTVEITDNRGRPKRVIKMNPCDRRTSDSTRLRVGLPRLAELRKLETRYTREFYGTDVRS